jgi:hypothetical protein
MKECWKDIPGYDGYYEVSDLGNVRSKTRYVKHNCGGLKKVEGQEKQAIVLNNGYHMIHLYKHGKGKGMLVHRLVMLAFVGQCPDNMEVRHLNSNRADNRLCNLTYGTHSENSIDTAKLGRHGKQRLTPSEVVEIRELLADGEMVKTVASKYGVSTRTIGQIKNRHSYLWL